MSSIVVRGLEESVKKKFAAQAKEHGRSLEAEVRDILTQSIRRLHIGLALMQAAQKVGGIEDLPLGERTAARRRRTLPWTGRPGPTSRAGVEESG